MPGIASVWLTQEELDALLLAASSKTTRVSDRIWANVEPKLKSARDQLGCPVPKYEGVGAPDPVPAPRTRPTCDEMHQARKELFMGPNAPCA